MLDRHVEVRHDARIARDHVEQTGGEAGAVQVEQAKPGNRRLREELLEQLGQGGAVAAVAPVVGKVLRHEVHFARALHLEQLRLAYHVLGAERAMLAAHERDGAEGAAVVAALADLEVAHVRAFAHRQPVAGMQQKLAADQTARLQPRNQLVGLRGAQKEIDLGERLEEFSLVALDHAADGDEALQRAVRLEASGVDDGIERFLLGRIDEAAGVDDDELCVAEVIDGNGAEGGELREVALAVDGVLVATEGD